MAPLTRTRTITISLVIAVVLIVAAFHFSGHSLSFHTSTASAESTQELLKAYAAKDTDGDGLPDWQEALYGTDPNNAHSARASLTDSQAVAQGLVTPQYAATPAATGVSTSKKTIDAAVPGPSAAPGSLTEQFAQQFFNAYVQNRGSTAPSADQMQTFVTNAITQLESTQAKIAAYSTSDVHVSGKGGAALKAYAGAMDDAFAKNTVQLPFDELTYFSDAVEKGDAIALHNVGLIGGAYVNIAKAAVAASVPEEAAAAHLAVVNAMAALGGTINDMAAVDTDPIRGMLGLQSYTASVASLSRALTQMYAVFAAENVTVSPADSGWSFFHLIAVAQTEAGVPAP